MNRALNFGIEAKSKHARSGVLMSSVLLCRSALGGIAVFSPANQTVQPGTIVSFDVTLAAEVLEFFNGTDLVIGSALPFAFEYSHSFTSAMPNITRPEPVGVYPYDLLVGGSNPTAGAPSSILLGTVTIPTDALGLGEYSVGVDTQIDGFSSMGRFGEDPRLREDIRGIGTFVVVPEPSVAILTTFGMLLGAGVGFVSRRFRSRFNR